MLIEERIAQLENFVQVQAQANFRYEVLIRSLVDSLAKKSLVMVEEVNTRAEEIKTELLAAAKAVEAANQVPADASPSNPPSAAA